MLCHSHHFLVTRVTSKDRALHLTRVLSFSANITCVTLPSTWWMAPTSIQSCCSIMALWPGYDWAHMDSNGWVWFVSHVDFYVIIFSTSDVEMSDGSVTGDKTYSNWHWEDLLLFKMPRKLNLWLWQVEDLTSACTYCTLGDQEHWPKAKLYHPTFRFHNKFLQLPSKHFPGKYWVSQA